MFNLSVLTNTDKFQNNYNMDHYVTTNEGVCPKQHHLKSHRENKE